MELNLHENVLKGVYLYGFTQLSEIQTNGIKSISTGKDCIIQSQSGTGKTAIYLLGIIKRLEESTNKFGLIIVPTKELVNQIYSVAHELLKYTNYKIIKCMGGTSIVDFVTELKTASIIIGTIGRSYHMIKNNNINMHKLKFLIMDEADELLSNNLDDKLQFIINKIPTDTQKILISATISKNILNVTKQILNDPIKILLKNNEVIVNSIKQFYVDTETDELKFDVLMDIYKLISTSQAIIFCNTKYKIEWLEKQLIQNNFPITVIHASMLQQERNNIMAEFRDGTTRLLLTTDLLSRGIDIPQVNMVINYDMPNNKETYIHRIGRCGRFNKKGVAISLVKMKDNNDYKLINMLKYTYDIDISELPPNINQFLD